MLRTNNKNVQFKLDAHVLENFWPDNYGSGTIGLQNLVDQIDYMQHPGDNLLQTAIRYVEGGSLLVYYDDQRRFLKELLEQTDEEADRFSNAKIWNTYIHLISRTIVRLYKARQVELERLS